MLKHIVLIDLLEHLVKKDKPFDYIDTHAGAGVYSLKSEQAKKTQEFHNGIGKLIPSDWPELDKYFSIVKQLNPDKQLSQYPGSPFIASQFLRSSDQSSLFELHSTDFELLNSQFRSQRNIRVNKQDGFGGLLSIVPPKSRRALVLIDPSYEVKEDYKRVVDTIKNAHKKFATGVYAIWYPVVDRDRIEQMEADLTNSGIKRIQLFELGLHADTEAHGMTSSGMIVINPPWTLFERMELLLPRLTKALNVSGEAFYRCEELVGE